MFAREAHKDQVRKYTGNPYVDHSGGGGGNRGSTWMAARGGPSEHHASPSRGCTTASKIRAFRLQALRDEFGLIITARRPAAVRPGDRQSCGAQSLPRAPGWPRHLAWVQTIKCADLISNTSSIVKHDPKFAVTYLEEKRLAAGRADEGRQATFAARTVAGCASVGKRTTFPKKHLHHGYRFSILHFSSTTTTTNGRKPS
jgi:guanosine-3',5'-bis(diphosphate) 3'-pyrophosphohydrolase